MSHKISTIERQHSDKAFAEKNREMEAQDREINVNSIVMGGVDTTDYPDFCDAYIEYAEFNDGTELTEEQLEALTKSKPELVAEQAWEYMLGGA